MPNVRLPQSSATLPAASKQYVYFFGDGKAEGHKGMKEILGGTAHLGGLAEELQKLIGVRVSVGDPLTRVKLGRKVKEAEQLGSLAVAIGLGIED